MNPEFLPEFAFLLAGVLAIGFALHLLIAKQPSRAMKVGVVGLACVALALVSGRFGHKPRRPSGLFPAAKNSMSLVLGGVLLRVAPSDRYVLSVDSKNFLDLELQHSELRATCVVGARRGSASIYENTFPSRQPDVLPSKPDTHTLVVQEEGKDVFRMHYSEPQRIEIIGQFFDKNAPDSLLISTRGGLYWSGRRIPSGTVIDLRDQGEGRIDFGRSGLIRVRQR